MSSVSAERVELRRPRRTLAEELRHQLADEIRSGALAPGAALDETELARRFAVSRTPVREAIRQLDASGLVEVRPHRGAVVARPSEERLRSRCVKPVKMQFRIFLAYFRLRPS